MFFIFSSFTNIYVYAKYQLKNLKSPFRGPKSYANQLIFFYQEPLWQKKKKKRPPEDTHIILKTSPKFFCDFL